MHFSKEAPPFADGAAGCVERVVDGVSPAGSLIIVGDDKREECPTEGAQFGITIDGRSAGTFTFAAGQTVGTTFVVGPESMRFSAFDRDGGHVLDRADIVDGAGRVTSVDCALIRELTGILIPPGVAVYVMPDELRPGCGAPGRRVRFYRAGQALEPLVDWRPGQIQAPEFTLAQPPVVPPNTGTGPSRSETLPLVGLVFMVTGGLLVTGSAISRRVK